MTVAIRAIVENASDGLGWNAVIHLPRQEIYDCGPHMDHPKVAEQVQRTVRNFFRVCWKRGIDDGLPVGGVAELQIEFRNP